METAQFFADVRNKRIALEYKVTELLSAELKQFQKETGVSISSVYVTPQYIFQLGKAGNKAIDLALSTKISLQCPL